ncbi:NAD(P)-dependent oxidoreductase [Dongia soli]|uniref:dihydrouracil dehydrogenase (NAD(+)) n=1 Tax=Dongia soli TaxID=600628 RepID=A0ABU5EBE7_9PROT|nr:NAD(P)-dependent oxidoreductase [Dongia soli]MDY0883207.1 NAD(P)-dependent oxidoreductase [Dongia soli]
MAQSATPDIAAARLQSQDIDRNFEDVKPVLDRKKAIVESSRCYFCYDAPCTEACPTSIDIPNFIRMISTDNVRGAAEKIFEQNILGGMCARVCPTEILCEDACVRNTSEDKPVNIGALQRYATDRLIEQGIHPFQRQAPSGQKVAVIGGGPAGLSCAHRLAMLGHDVTIFEARDKLGGLNEYGIAAYKTVEDFAQREIRWLMQIGGIAVNTGKALGRDLALEQLRHDYEAVFVGLGLAGVNALGLDGEEVANVQDAVDYIAKLRQAADKSKLPVGRKVLVIGGGNTAIDIAIQSKRLGAEDVTLVYRRGPDQMTATWHEQEFAQVNGVKIKHWAKPVRLISHQGAAREVEFEYTQLDDQGRLIGTGETFSLLCDVVFKAIGQKLVKDPVNGQAHESLDLANGKIVVNEDMQTSLPNVWAGGDCVASGTDLTVQGVEDGKIAAIAIDRYLRRKNSK